MTSTHYITPAEEKIMADIDQLVANLGRDERILINFDFLRDYTLSRLYAHYKSIGARAYTARACLCVGGTRYLMRDRDIQELKWKKTIKE